MRRPRPSAMSLTLWSECKEARLASRTPRLTDIGLRLHPRGTRSCTTVVPDFSEGWSRGVSRRFEPIARGTGRPPTGHPLFDPSASSEVRAAR